MEDVEIDLPSCDLCISYARHPDVILAIVEQGVPVVLGITPGPGLVRQAKEINPAVAAPPTMCSLEPTTGSREIDMYAERFGLPGFQTCIENGTIAQMEIIREAPCGSTRGLLLTVQVCHSALKHSVISACGSATIVLPPGLERPVIKRCRVLFTSANCSTVSRKKPLLPPGLKHSGRR